MSSKHRGQPGVRSNRGRPWAQTIGPSLILLTSPLFQLNAQVPADLARERSGFAGWLATAPNSPYAAIVQQPVGTGLSLGPAGSDVPLDGLAPTGISEGGGGVTLTQGPDRHPLPRLRLFPIGDFRGFLSGSPGRSILTVYGKASTAKAPQYFPYAPTLGFTVRLAPSESPTTHRILTLDGLEVVASEAGFVEVPLGTSTARLTVYRIPDPGTEESDLEIYFRDASNGRGSYPAGRFVSLVPLPDGRYRLDFNRARNPFCAYSTVYPCPAPWPGNRVTTTISAGERYESTH